MAPKPPTLDLLPAGCQRWRDSDTRPLRSATPSRPRSRRCVSMLSIRARRLIPPLAFTTRCHGTSCGHSCIACPTARAARGRPSSAAICP